MTCEVHFKDEAAFVVAWTTDAKESFRRHFRDVLRLDTEPTASTLGRAVRRALDLSGTAIPQEGAAGFDESLRTVGLKGWSSLASSSRSLWIRDDGSRIVIHAERRDGDARLDEVIQSRDPEEVGRSLLGMRPLVSVSDPLRPVRPGASYRRSRPEPVADGGTPRNFGYKLHWIVVDTTDAGAVVSALRLKDVRPATWDIDPYDFGGVFVSPSVLGWTFILGLRLEPGSPGFAPVLEDLSRRFGEAQYFGTHRVVELQAWAKAVDGRIVRGYCWIGESGEVVMDVGDSTPEEVELGFSRFINARTVDGDWEELEFPNEEDVLLVASKWSVNPRELDTYDSEGLGFLGREP